MNQAMTRREPRTFLIYGVAAVLILVWWSLLRLLGADVGLGGRVLLAAVAAAVLGVAVLKDRFGMLCLIVASLPFSLGILQFEVSIVTLNPYTLGITIAAALAVASGLLGRRRLRLGSEEILVLLLGAAFLLSTLRADDIVEGGFLAFHGVFIPIVTYFALKELVTTPEEYRKILISFLVGAVAFAAYGLVQFAQNPQRLFVLGMASISAAAIITSAIILIVSLNLWRRPVGMLSLLLLLGGLLATFSRGYIVLLLASPVIYRFFRRGYAGKAMVGMLAATLAGTLLMVTSYEVFRVRIEAEQAREQTVERMTDPSYWLSALYGRARYYAFGLDEFAKSPIIGNGLHKGYPSPQFGRPVVWHNFHVEWLEYGGILAYVLYAGVFIAHFRGSARAARQVPPLAANLTVLFVVLLNGLTNSFTAGVSPTLGFLFMGLNCALRTRALPRRGP